MLTGQAILHPTDFSEHSKYAFHLASSLARDYDAHLHVLHVMLPSPSDMGEMLMLPPLSRRDELAAAEAKLHDLQNETTKVRIETEVREGDPAEQILQAATDHECALIVMGTHGRTGLSRLLMGSVAEQVVRKAGCPVLTVKTPVPEMAQTEKKLLATGTH
jgi:nucleotide-binding universal stress UspA family protein